MTLSLVPHDSRWKAAFDSEALVLSRALGCARAAIHHIGSTAVPGLLAKPIIDCLVEVPDLSTVDLRTAQMEKAGYEARGENGISGRRYFRSRESRGQDRFHVHVFAAGSAAGRRHIAFRDYLLAFPEAAQDYGHLKAALAARGLDRKSYQAAKSGFVASLADRAVAWMDGGPS